MKLRGTAATKFSQVKLVGGEDEVEPKEIIRMHLSRAEFRQVIAAYLCMSDRARVRRLADVVIFRAGGIELDGQSGLPGLSA